MLTPSVQHMYADFMFCLGGCKYLCMGILNGEPLLRLHDLAHTDQTGRYYRYVNMNVQQWAELVHVAKDIIPATLKLAEHNYSQASMYMEDGDDETGYSQGGEGVSKTPSPAELKVHLGKNLHIVSKPSSQYIHVRRYFLTDEENPLRNISHNDFVLFPTKEGIVFTFEEWAKLQQLFNLVNTILGDPPMETCQQKHCQGFNGEKKECSHCNPNGYEYWQALAKKKKNKKERKHVETSQAEEYVIQVDDEEQEEEEEEEEKEEEEQEMILKQGKQKRKRNLKQQQQKQNQ